MIKYLLIRIVKKILSFLEKKNENILTNIFKTEYSKTVLICHLKDAFISGENNKHTAYGECIDICSSFNVLGFNVDLIDYACKPNLDKIDISKYAVIFGQGESFESLFYKECNAIRIFYATGMHPQKNNDNSIERLNLFYKRHKRFLPNSIIINQFRWELSVKFSDYIFMWGNSYGLESFNNGYIKNENLKLLPAFFYKTVTDLRIDNNKKEFLWIGSGCQIHRGLDIVFDFFIKNKDLKLHVLTNTANEPLFFEYYNTILTSNIILHGFVDIGSDYFSTILNDCSYQIYLSCAEGTSASVLTGVGNGALLPIITKECCFSPNLGEVILDDDSIESLENAMSYALHLSDEELIARRISLYDFVNSHHTRENYKNTLIQYLRNLTF